MDKELWERWEEDGMRFAIPVWALLEPDDDELMYQYDNEIDEHTAEESWS